MQNGREFTYCVKVTIQFVQFAIEMSTAGVFFRYRRILVGRGKD